MLSFVPLLTDRVVMPRAFSTVVADNQFAVLGVVLMSILADLAGVLQIKLDPLPTASLLRAYPFAERKKETMDKGSLEASPAGAEDVGEVVCRERDTIGSAASKKMAGSDSERTLEKSKGKIEGNRAPKKKNKKKRNTIDDLFDGIL